MGRGSIGGDRIALAGMAIAALVCAMASAEPPHHDRRPAKRGALTDGLLDQNGAPFSLERVKGKTVVLNFIFTHCASACPLQTQALRRVQQALAVAVRERVHFVSVSVDPERDTPSVLAAFAKAHDLDVSRWTLVTGPPAQVVAFGDRFSVRELPEGAGPADHRTEVRLIDGGGKVMQTYRGGPLDEPRLIREIQTVDHMFHMGLPR